MPPAPKKWKAKDNLFKWVLRAIKSNNSCMDCNIRYPWYIMEFDHRDGINYNNFPPSKSQGAPGRARIRRRPCVSHICSWSSLFRELSLCDVVCANCHRVRSFLRGEWGEALDTS